MGTYSGMKTRIATQIKRNNLDGEISAAIHDAIAHFERPRFIFNTTTSELSLTDGQRFYGLPSDFKQPINLVVYDTSNNPLPLSARPHTYIESIDTAANYKTIPQLVAFFGTELRFYPCPDAAYLVKMRYHQTLDTDYSASSSDAWLTDAERMIRLWARAEVRENILQGSEIAKADRDRAMAMQEFNDLRGEYIIREASGTLIPYSQR
jgi:hypothetical protein